MILPLEAAWEVHEVLTTLGVPYAVIGGIAVQVFDRARSGQAVLTLTGVVAWCSIGVNFQPSALSIPKERRKR